MKELDPRLTRQTIDPTLRSEGRFMTTEVSDVQTPPAEPALQSVPTDVKTEKPVKSWQMWGSFLEDKKGRPLSRSEKRVLDMAAELKVEWWKDPSQVKDPEKETSWQTNKVREFIIRFGDGLIQRRGKASSDYFETRIAEIDIAVDRGEISPAEANVLRRHVGAYLAEAQAKELAEAQAAEQKRVEKHAAELARQAGETRPFSNIQTDIQGIYKDLARIQLNPHQNLQVHVPPNFNLPPGWGVGGGGVVVPPGAPGGPGGPGGGGGGGQAPVDVRVVDSVPLNVRVVQSQESQEQKEIREKIEEFRKVIGLEPPDMNPPATNRLDALISSNPDFESAIFADLRVFIDSLDPTDYHVFYAVAREAVGLNDVFNISEKSRELLFEFMYEKLIGKPDKGAEDMHYKVGSFYVLDLLDKLDHLAYQKFDQDFFRHMTELQHVRQVMHELNISLKYGEQYKEFIIKELSAVGVDFVYNDIAGVSQVWAQIERVGGNMVSRGKSEWLSDADWKKVYREINHIFDDSNPDREILEEDHVETHNNQPVVVTRKLTTWEKDRAIKLAKILHAGLQRRGMYSFLGNLPPMAHGPGRIASTQDVYVGRSVMPKKQAMQFFPGSKGAGEGSKVLMEKIADVEIEEGEGNEDPDKRTLYLPLFGIDPRVIVYDDNQSYDMMSHSWRGPKEFYDPILINIDVPDPNNPNNMINIDTTLMDDLMEQARDIDPKKADPILGAGELGKEEKIKLSQRVRDIVLGQRLYLSTFPRHGNFDIKLKTEIWKKIALLTPSSISTLLPESINSAQLPQGFNNQEVWEGLRAKLFAAEGRRVKHDMRNYFQPQTLADLQAERTAFEQIAGHVDYHPNQPPPPPNQQPDLTKYRFIGPKDQDNPYGRIIDHTVGIADAPNWGAQEWTDILHYMGLDALNQPVAQGGLTDEEKLVLKGIVQTGLNRAHDLARSKMPFTFLIVDAPKISLKPSDRQYGGVSDADYIRLLASDQQTIQEGVNEGFNALVENPTKDPIGHYEKFLAGIARVHGRDAAFSATRSLVIGWHWMAAQEGKAEWIPLYALHQQILDQATSLMNKHFPGGRIAYNKEELKNSLMAWAQAGAWSKTEINKLRRELKASPDWMILFWLMSIATVMTPIEVEEFVKLIIPKIR